VVPKFHENPEFQIPEGHADIDPRPRRTARVQLDTLAVALEAVELNPDSHGFTSLPPAEQAGHHDTQLPALFFM
jgi:hypothetical protein